MSKLLIIGHRGAPTLAPENTLPSFRLAAQSGAQMVELDVQLSRDGRVVVIHDETLERTTGKGLVSLQPFARLKQFDAGFKFAAKFSGTRIPALEEVLTSLPPQIGLNIELKNNVLDYPGLEQKVLFLLSKYRTKKRTIISSFNWNSLAVIHRLDPKLRLGLLFHVPNKDLWTKAALLNAFSIHPPLPLTNEQLVW